MQSEIPHNKCLYSIGLPRPPSPPLIFSPLRRVCGGPYMRHCRLSPRKISFALYFFFVIFSKCFASSKTHINTLPFYALKKRTRFFYFKVFLARVSVEHVYV